MASGYSTPLTNYAEEHSYAHLPKPFKSAQWAQRSSSRRNKNLKQVIALEKERVDNVIKTRSETWVGAVPAAAANGGTSATTTTTGLMDVDSCECRVRFSLTPRRSCGIPLVVDMSIDAAPSVLPAKKYCDVTGLEAKYVDPASTLHYHNPEVYEVIKTFQPGVIQSYLANRGQGVILR
ncbi:BQ5605_C019g08839 [Microbotryum silenes-dioicae]|uniref:BQ5605_C019g08839 protein n=1 Tax=Microbotryum silenes-dioicae TaxID=796604 RepID=A0A2X0MHN8_9BASI|nr:BQ5605_C019g08839 [Microbotryum silenes-dioicae]